MEQGTVYNIPAECWFYSITQKDTKMMYIQDSNYSMENGDFADLTAGDVVYIQEAARKPLSEQKMVFRFALFDFDGVIADTEESNLLLLGKALARHGIVLTDEDRKRLVGVNDTELLKSILSRAWMPVTLEQFCLERKALGNTYENGDLTPMPGLLPLLRRFREKGILMALVSSTSAYLLDAALKRLELTEFFPIVIGGDMVRRKKPDPEPYLAAMEQLNATPEECVIFEDSPAGIRAGKAAGCYVIAYRGGKIRQDTRGADMALNSYFRFDSLIL